MGKEAEYHDAMIRMLELLGAKTTRKDNTLEIDTADANGIEASLTNSL